VEHTRKSERAAHRTRPRAQFAAIRCRLAAYSWQLAACSLQLTVCSLRLAVRSSSVRAAQSSSSVSGHSAFSLSLRQSLSLCAQLAATRLLRPAIGQKDASQTPSSPNAPTETPSRSTLGPRAPLGRRRNSSDARPALRSGRARTPGGPVSAQQVPVSGGPLLAQPANTPPLSLWSLLSERASLGELGELGQSLAPAEQRQRVATGHLALATRHSSPATCPSHCCGVPVSRRRSRTLSRRASAAIKVNCAQPLAS